MPETIVITRPRQDAKKLASALTKKGFHHIIEPILSIRTLYGNAESLEHAMENKPQAILATSKHAISAFAAMTEIRAIPLVTVGQATAKHAMGLGFHNVVFANGSAASLVAYVAANYSPENGALLYIRGRDISMDIGFILSQDKYSVDSVMVYEAKKTRKLSAQLCKAVMENKVDSVAFFSQNTAKVYAKLAMESNIALLHNRITALCLSQAIANKTKQLLKWKKVMLFPSYLRS